MSDIPSLPESFVLTEEFCKSVNDVATDGFTKDRLDRLWIAIHAAAKSARTAQEPVGHCIWITPTKLAACAKSSRGSFPVYTVPKPSSEPCIECGGTGMVDSGGFHPWGESIVIPCGCKPSSEPTP